MGSHVGWDLSARAVQQRGLDKAFPEGRALIKASCPWAVRRKQGPSRESSWVFLAGARNAPPALAGRQGS